MTLAHLPSENFTCNGLFYLSWLPRLHFVCFMVRSVLGLGEVGPARLIQYISGDSQLSKNTLWKNTMFEKYTLWGLSNKYQGILSFAKILEKYTCKAYPIYQGIISWAKIHFGKIQCLKNTLARLIQYIKGFLVEQKYTLEKYNVWKIHLHLKNTLARLI